MPSTLQTLRPMGDPAPHPLVEAARALGPRIRASRDEIERGRRLPPSLVQILKEAGIFRMAMPRAWGGPELDPMTQIRVVEQLAMADGSVGWCAMIGSDAGYFTAFLDQAVARAMYPDLDAVTGGVTRPAGTAVVADGGYRVSGRWAFGSGCQHSTWLVSACVVRDADGPRSDRTGAPEIRCCFLPGAAVEVIDTWTTTGLRGTGSHDYAIEDHFVPAEHTFSLAHSPIRRSEPLYALRTMYLANISGVPLGIARAAIDAVVELADHKVTRIGASLRDQPHVHAAIARAEALVGSARSFVFDVVGNVWATLLAGEAPTLRQRALYRLAICNAFSACVEAVDVMYTVAGSSALYAGHPLDRCFRDIRTSNQHFSVSTRLAQAAGRVLVGLEPDAPGF